VPIVTNQAQYSLLDRRVDGAMANLCQESGIHLLCYGVLAGGFMTDKFFRAAEPGSPFDNRSLVKYKLIIDEFGGWSLLQGLLETLQKIATKNDTTIATVAARWALDRNRVAAVMIGVGSRDHGDNRRSVFDIRLDAEDLHHIDAVLARAKGPTGDPFDLERHPDSRHSQIMWTDLNARRNSS
jgi:aryl-alcohol dehydrogenase-like predicted oxidoreductase